MTPSNRPALILVQDGLISAINPETIPGNAKLTLYAGFTTVRDLWNIYGFTDVALMNAINKNLIEGPHLIPCGHMDITGLAQKAKHDY